MYQRGEYKREYQQPISYHRAAEPYYPSQEAYYPNPNFTSQPADFRRRDQRAYPEYQRAPLYPPVPPPSHVDYYSEVSHHPSPQPQPRHLDSYASRIDAFQRRRVPSFESLRSAVGSPYLNNNPQNYPQSEFSEVRGGMRERVGPRFEQRKGYERKVVSGDYDTHEYRERLFKARSAVALKEKNGPIIAKQMLDTKPKSPQTEEKDAFSMNALALAVPEVDDVKQICSLSNEISLLVLNRVNEMSPEEWESLCTKVHEQQILCLKVSQ